MSAITELTRENARAGAERAERIGVRSLNGHHLADAAHGRATAAGKFIQVGGEKLYVKGVTYGTFASDGKGGELYSRAVVDRDLAAMAASGVNAVRTYTVPPRWLLDCALTHGLRVLVGLPWEQHIAFADQADRRRSITARVREGVRRCAGHPAVLAYAIGNEIPASIVRWHGKRTIERFLERLYDAAKSEDPEGLVTYVNFPSTEYLDLPFLDFVCFNVYLEQRERLDAYLYRLQNLAGDRPLLLAEIGLDSRRNGEEVQARSLAWQIRAVFEGGAAGMFTFAWTDEWHRGGLEIDDWDFGLTTRDRRPKPALRAVSDGYRSVPRPIPREESPRVSVVVCTYNGAATLGECLNGLAQLDYPNYEVIVVNDGSTDESARIADRAGVDLVTTNNRGLARARNTGMELATGEIIAYIDDDATPDPQWLTHIVEAFARADHCAVGGPNIAPEGDGLIADCVANAPGGPIHVLVSDSEAEHIPGCNFAVRTSALRAIGGFDPQFTAAGDDVDVCWRLQERGWTIGFAPAAFVWHHRRNSTRAYWRQQRGYGKAEALLERKWPERYNRAGHVHWTGRMYGSGVPLPVFGRRQRVYHGSWGLGLFQSVYDRTPGTIASLPLMPEWYLLISALAAISALGALWRPLLSAVPLLLAAVATTGLQALKSARRAPLRGPIARRRRVAIRATTTLLHIAQPLARLWGRVSHGLSPWRLPGGGSTRLPLPRSEVAWSERWHATEERLTTIESTLRDVGMVVRAGGDFDNWDLEARHGAAGAVRARMAIEEHGQGRQLVRLRIWPRWPGLGLVATATLGALSVLAFLSGVHLIGVVLAAAAVAWFLHVAWQLSAATGAMSDAFERCSELHCGYITAPERSAVPVLEAEASV